MNPIFIKDGKWYFWDEIWLHKHGPFDTEKEANDALKEYARNL